MGIRSREQSAGTETAKAIVVLRKVLQLESRKGFRDDAAAGGIERFLNAQADHLPLAERTELRRLLTGYQSLERKERQIRIGAALALLDGETATVSAPVPPKPVPAPVQASQPARSAPVERPARPARPRPHRRAYAKSLTDPVTVLPGVGSGRAKQLEGLNVHTIGDLIWLLPRRYKDYTQVEPIDSIMFHREYTVKGTVISIETERTRTGKSLVTAMIGDATGRIPVIWFNPYIARQLTIGSAVALSGRVEQQRGTICFRNPEWELLDEELLHTGRIVPIYPLTRNLYQKQIRKLTRMALDAGLPLLEDPLPESVRREHQLMDLAEAVEAIHFPETEEDEQTARRRLAFDEFLVLQVGLLRRKVDWQSQLGTSWDVEQPRLDHWIGQLPFHLTGAQRRSLAEITADMADEKPMSRLLQGDVGSGKTAVAALASLTVIANGAQAAILAPTEILAEQHLRSLSRLFDCLPVQEQPRLGLLTGSSSSAERAEIDAGLRTGEIQVLIGTHAILEERVEFQRLGLVVIDEQHRFGVIQRARLRDKGLNPDVLVMTATPIPRSLALVLHGDLDVSVIDEMPPGRQPIETVMIEGDRRYDAYRFVRREVDAGHQAFIICPLVEESEAIEARAATAEYERLSTNVFPDLHLGLLHGRMRPAEKDAIMAAFRDGEIDILVSTSVVEVGIDVPNATIMLIEGSERFGLSQLHQFRGRVGRGADRSYCILIADDASENARQRLDALVETQDGFRLAEVDLQLRGPGEFFGTRQSGLPDLRFASLAALDTLQEARDEAQRLLKFDYDLSEPEHRVLGKQVERFWRKGMGDVS